MIRRAKDTRKRIAGDSGNRYQAVKAVVRDEQGNIVAQPGDVRKVGEEVAVANEVAREERVSGGAGPKANGAAEAARNG